MSPGLLLSGPKLPPRGCAAEALTVHPKAGPLAVCCQPGRGERPDAAGPAGVQTPGCAGQEEMTVVRFLLRYSCWGFHQSRSLILLRAWLRFHNEL